MKTTTTSKASKTAAAVVETGKSATALRSRDGRTVAMTAKGQARGHALVTCRDAQGSETSHVFPVAQARAHFASLHAQGWR